LPNKSLSRIHQTSDTFLPKRVRDLPGAAIFPPKPHAGLPKRAITTGAIFFKLACIHGPYGRQRLNENLKESHMKHYAVTAIFTFVLSIIFSATAYAAPPPNDNFASAQTISGLSGTITGTNAEATKQAGEWSHAWNIGGRSVWYKYVAPGNGVMTITTSSNFNSLLAVYQGSTFADLRIVAANDDIYSGSFHSVASRVTFGTVAGMTYYIAVDGWNDGAGQVGSGAIQFTYQLSNSPEIDNFNSNTELSVLSTSSTVKTLTVTNLGAGKEVGEPNHAGNAGGKSIWFQLQTFSGARSYSFTLEPKVIGNPNAGITTLFAIYQGPNVATLTPVTSTVIQANHTGRLTLNAPANQIYWLAIDGYDSGGGAAAGNFLLTYGSTVGRKQPDFDRDGKADLTVYRPLNGIWYTLDSITGNFRYFQWGTNGDKPFVNHWDDDERTDYSVFRPDTQMWYPYLSTTLSYTSFSWGLDTDIPLTINRFSPGLGLNNCYATVFRRSTGTWWINTNPGVISLQFGQNGDVPITADFNGDGTDEIAVFRPSNGVWYFANAFTGADNGFQQFGVNGDIPVPADYDGDGRVDIAVFRPSNRVWYILQSADGSVRSVQFGASGDKPQPADYERFGQDNIAVFRPSTGTWYILGVAGNVKAVQFGQNGDIPMVAPSYTNQ
jgi:hypothetical protein